MWRPVLDGDAAAAALQTARELAEALRTCDQGDTLLGGAPGVAVFLAHAARVLADESLGEAASELLSGSLERAGESLASPYLFDGFAGLGWAVEHVGRVLGWQNDEDLLADVDELVLARLERRGPATRFEAMFGTAGFAVYAAERLPRPSAREILVRVVDALVASAREPAPGELTWFTSTAQMDPGDAAMFPSGYHSLGVAHGVPGIMAALALAERGGVAAARAPFLAAGRWLRGLVTARAGSHLPSLAEERRPARTAWCYGDIGVAAALLPGAAALGDDATHGFCLELAAAAATRAPEATGVDDPMFCHGGAGLAHLLARAGQAEAARAWFMRSLEMRRAGLGVAGFAAAVTGPAGDTVREARAGLLDGAAGLGLALLAAASPAEPSWDRVFLLA